MNLPRTKGTDPVVLAADVYNAIADAIERHDRLLASGSSASKFRTVVRGKITSAVSSRAGWYNAKRALDQVNPSATGNAVIGDFCGTFSPNEDLLVLYIPDMGSGTAGISDFTDANAPRILFTGYIESIDQSTGKPIVVVYSLSSVHIFPVLVTSDGGSGGSGTTVPSWTYTVKDYETSVTLKKNAAGDNATTMIPELGRADKRETTAGTKGTAFYKSNGDLVLWMVEEPEPEYLC